MFEIKSYTYNTKRIIYISILLFIFIGCSQLNKSSNTLIQKVDIRGAIMNKENVLLSNFANGDIEYIPLESKKSFLLSAGSRFYVKDSIIVAVSSHQIYLFDRYTGQFIKEIGHYGKDPDGYKETVFSNPFDEERNLFLASGWETNKYYQYDFQGNLKNEITAPEELYATSIAVLEDTVYTAYNWNYNGIQKTKLIVFSKDNKNINTFPQFLSFDWDISKGISIPKWSGWFYKHNNEVNFLEAITDTIFRVTKESLMPVYVLEKGEFGPSYDEKFTKKFSDELPNYYFTESVFESSRYLFLKLRLQQNYYFGLFDKETRETILSRNPYGVENDIDNFIPFRFISTNNKNEIIGYQDAYEVLDWFTQNPENAKQLPEQLKKLQNIREGDNPVVMIAKLKE